MFKALQGILSDAYYPSQEDPVMYSLYVRSALLKEAQTSHAENAIVIKFPGLQSCYERLTDNVHGENPEQLCTTNAL